MRVTRFLVFGLIFLAACSSSPQPKTTTPPGSDRAKGHGEVRKLRVLTYNIHHAEGTDGQLALDRIAKVIQSAEPDIVALQEVDDRTTRTKSVNQAAELARLTGMNGKFGQAMLFQGGGYGQTILSRWPIRSTTVYTLPQEPGREPRIAFAAEIAVDAKEPNLLFVTTHLDHEIERIRISQATRIKSLLSTNQLPAILAGDFNAGPESETMKIFSADWLDSASDHPAPTIPSEKPRRRIDYILLHPAGAWRVLETRVMDEAVASDHRPVLAVVEMGAQAK